MIKASILNTRPVTQQLYTTDVFKKYGFAVINFPCIDITTVDIQDTVCEQLNCIDPNNVIIFTSQYAVEFAFKINPDWQIHHTSTVIAVGAKTAERLEQNYHNDIWVPKQQNSDGVIDLLKGLKTITAIKLITAANGRDSIQKYAQLEGIKLQQINVYKRQLPKVNQKALIQIEKSRELYVLATSATTLNNLNHLLPKQLWDKVLASKLICASSRIVTAAKEIGFKKPENMMTADPDLIAKKLLTMLHP